MIFLKKKNDSEVIALNLNCSTNSMRTKIRKIILQEQYGFCSYSERYIELTDSPELEHFDPRIKDTQQDNYFNWYVVIRWMNSHKPKKIEPFLPMLLPNSADLEKRIVYIGCCFSPANSEDKEAKKLIDFLGMNKYEISLHRTEHIARIKDLKKLYN